MCVQRVCGTRAERRERSIIAGAAFRALEDVRLEKHGLDGRVDADVF